MDRGNYDDQHNEQCTNDAKGTQSTQSVSRRQTMLVKMDIEKHRAVSLCSSKLKDRELTLIDKRQKKCLEVIELSIDQFTRRNTKYFIEFRGKTTIRVQRMDKTNREMMNLFLNPQTYRKTIASCSAALTAALQRWDGIHRSTNFTESDAVPFKAYYRTAKNWFDQCKVTLLSEVYWIPMLAVIEQVLPSNCHNLL